MIDKNRIDVIISKIKNKIKPVKIYIFGSYVNGIPDDDSDLDLLIIKDKIVNKRKELIELKKELISKDYSLDILLYTEEEYIRKKNENWKIFEEIDKQGHLYHVQR